MPKSLDRSRPFAEVINSSDGTMFVQDETPFNALGDELGTVYPDTPEQAAEETTNTDPQGDSNQAEQGQETEQTQTQETVEAEGANSNESTPPATEESTTEENNNA